jgi:hypothetical protein
MLPDWPTDAERWSPLRTGEPLDDADWLYRRLIDDDTSQMCTGSDGLRRPSSAAFAPNDDGVSVYSEQAMVATGASTADLILPPANLLARISVRLLRVTFQLDVVGDPWPRGIREEGHRRNASHALIVGLEMLTTKERKRRQRGIAESGLELVRP